MLSFTPQQRRLAFEALVLQALWLLMLRAFGSNPRVQVIHWRAHAIGYLDEVGVQSEPAKEHRRETAFPELRVP